MSRSFLVSLFASVSGENCEIPFWRVKLIALYLNMHLFQRKLIVAQSGVMA